MIVSYTLMAQVLSTFSQSSSFHPWRTLLDSPSPLSTSASSSCLSPSSSSTSSCSLSSTTRSSWQTCAAPLQKRVSLHISHISLTIWFFNSVGYIFVSCFNVPSAQGSSTGPAACCPSVEMLWWRRDWDCVFPGIQEPTLQRRMNPLIFVNDYVWWLESYNVDVGDWSIHNFVCRPSQPRIDHSPSSLRIERVTHKYHKKLFGTLMVQLDFVLRASRLAQPCRAKKEIHTSHRKLAAEVTVSHKVPKTIYGGVVEFHESTRQRVEPSFPRKNTKTTVWAMDFVDKFILKPQAMKIPDAKAAVDKEWKKSETILAWQTGESKVKRRLFSKHKETKGKPNLPHWWTYDTSKNAELESKFQMCRGRVVLRGEHCKRTFWSGCSFYWTRLVCVPNDCRTRNGCYCKITRLRRTSSWCSIRVQSSKFEGHSQTAQNSKVRVSR